MDAPKILPDESLRNSYPKLNQSIENSNKALSTANIAKTAADEAVTTANDANAKSDDTQQQLNNIVINNGESDAEVLQARGSYSVLNERLSATDEQLAENGQDMEGRAFSVKFPPAPLVAAKGDNTTDDTSAIKALNEHIKSKGGGRLFFPKSSGAYLLNDDIVLGNNTIVECQGYIKRSGIGGIYDSVFVGQPGADGITIINPLIDCNNQLGMNGIIARRNNTNFKVFGGHIKNCKHDKGGKLGGRALIIEAGSNQLENGAKRALFDGVSVTNCYMAICLQGGDNQNSNNNIVTNIMAENCEVLIGLFGNSTGYPHKGDSMSYIVSNITAKNCGYSTTYTRQHGLICSDRGSNIIINGLYCFNESTYGKIKAVFCGDAANINADNIVFDGDSDYVYLGYGYQEKDSIVDGGYVTQNNDFKIKHNGTVTDIFGLTSSVTSRLIKSFFDITTKTVVNNRATTTSIQSNPNVMLDIKNRDNNTRLKGFASDISSGISFSNHANKDTFVKGINVSDANGGSHRLTIDSTGRLLVDGVVVGTQT